TSVHGANTTCDAAVIARGYNPPVVQVSFIERTPGRSRNDYAEPFILDMSVSAIAAGVSATAIPAACSASIFPAAVPFPPETIAPAWPIRRPGGAVFPAMNAATGFLQFDFIHSAAS